MLYANLALYIVPKTDDSYRFRFRIDCRVRILLHKKNSESKYFEMYGSITLRTIVIYIDVKKR